MVDETPHIEDFANLDVKVALEDAGPDELHAILMSFRMRHQALDHELNSLRQAPYLDGLRIQRLKKEKLHLKDHMAKISALLYPDIIA